MKINWMEKYGSWENFCKHIIQNEKTRRALPKSQNSGILKINPLFKNPLREKNNENE